MKVVLLNVDEIHSPHFAISSLNCLMHIQMSKIVSQKENQYYI